MATVMERVADKDAVRRIGSQAFGDLQRRRRIGFARHTVARAEDDFERVRRQDYRALD